MPPQVTKRLNTCHTNDTCDKQTRPTARPDKASTTEELKAGDIRGLRVCLGLATKPQGKLHLSKLPVLELYVPYIHGSDLGTMAVSERLRCGKPPYAAEPYIRTLKKMCETLGPPTVFMNRPPS